MMPALLMATVVAGLLAVALPAAQAPPVDRLLTDVLGFSRGDLRDLYAGKAIARILDTDRAEEVASAGAVLIDAPVATLVSWSHGVEGFKRGSGVKQIGIFHEPFDRADLGGLVLPPEDLGALAACQVGDCALKLTAGAIERFRTEVRWGTGAASVDATRIMRDVLFQMLVDYRRDGLGALGPFVDKPEPLDVQDAFYRIAAHDPLLADYAPGVFAYVTSFPRRLITSVDDIFYWSTIDFGLKPTMRLDHLSMHPIGNGRDGLGYVFASTQIYAAHYFRTALDLRFVFPRPDGRGFVLINTARSDSDGLTGMFGWLVRAKVRRGTRSGLLSYLETMKTTLEHQARAAAPPRP
ncbi:MAG: hypothetical protein AB7H88_02865 [Vicinamibacterales bacterium]